MYYMQYVHFLQRKYSLSSFNLLGHTAPAQAASLLLLGPFLDCWLTNKRVDRYDYNTGSLVSTGSQKDINAIKLNILSLTHLFIFLMK